MQDKKLFLHTPFYLILFFLIFLGSESLAQSQVKQKKSDQKKTKGNATSNYTGNAYPQQRRYQGTGKDLTVKNKKIKSRAQLKRDSKRRSLFTSKSKFEDKSAQRQQNSSLASSFRGGSYAPVSKGASRETLSGYRGRISVSKLNSNQRKYLKQNNKLSNYRGNIRVTNTLAKRKKNSQKMDSFRGANPIRVRKSPRGALVASNRKSANNTINPASYNRKNLKGGRKMSKKYLANYQKAKPKKLKYNKKEVKMWQEGGVVIPKRAERTLPKAKVRKKNREEGEEEGEQ